MLAKCAAAEADLSEDCTALPGSGRGQGQVAGALGRSGRVSPSWRRAEPYRGRVTEGGVGKQPGNVRAARSGGCDPRLPGSGAAAALSLQAANAESSGARREKAGSASRPASGGWGRGGAGSRESLRQGQRDCAIPPSRSTLLVVETALRFLLKQWWSRQRTGRDGLAQRGEEQADWKRREGEGLGGSSCQGGGAGRGRVPACEARAFRMAASANDRLPPENVQSAASERL